MKRVRIYILEPAGLLDTTDPRVVGYKGVEVQKVQPPGTPKNGTMRQCYVQTLDGEFIGMVNEASLKETNRTAPLRDKAAEAREARSLRILPGPEAANLPGGPEYLHDLAERLKGL